MLHVPRFLMVVSAVALIVSSPAAASGRSEGPAEAPPAPVLLSVELPGEMQWYYQNDVGMLLVYAGGRLHRIDLLDEKPGRPEATDFPELTEPRSVVPVTGTGLLLIPETKGATRSCAYDTLSGGMLWEADPLPRPALVFSFPDRGLAVLLSWETGGRLTAIDLGTGKKQWEFAKPMETVWHDGRYLRLITERHLLTLEIDTGKTVRTDELTLPKSKLRRAYPAEGVVIAWSNKNLKAYSLPPAPPAEPSPPSPMWEFKAASPMMDLPIKAGKCYIRRIEDDLLVVNSVRHYELLRLSTGQRILDIKRGMLGFDMPFILSPGGKVVAVAENEGLQVYDGGSGESIHDIRYPKGREGLKTARRIRWLDDDVIATIFPDKKGNPRRMSAFSSSKGKLLWSVGLPESADYELTSRQRAQLIGRITASLFATAASIGHPMSVGGTNYAVVLVPNLDVSINLDAGGATGRSVTSGESAFDSARKRIEECERRTAPGAAAHSYYAAGHERNYEILMIDLADGEVATAFTYTEPRVHSIAFFPGFERALSIENNNRRVRLLSME